MAFQFNNFELLMPLVEDLCVQGPEESYDLSDGHSLSITRIYMVVERIRGRIGPNPVSYPIQRGR